MWYAVQVRTGAEENIILQCRKIIPQQALERCFIPYCKEQKKYLGKWHLIKKPLFPGYVFMISDDLESLWFGLKKVVGITKLLGTGREIVPLRDEEIDFLTGLGGEKQLVDISVGVMEGSNVKIISGPLQGMEGYIKKIDRHKRKAWLEVSMFNRKIQTQVGLEVISKNPDAVKGTKR